ncbi:1053_t:CDS:2 [Entrophospora sp. SA101]|nr:1053_t:CDS:2 [Entrophospora sp. SA101]CAJ0834011.1 5629_t:CDS:2 [Entrophospora sp. SA101]
MSVCKLWKELVQKVISEHLNLMHKECWKFGFRFEIKESSFEYNTFSTSFKYTPPIIEYEFSNESSTIIFDPDNELFPRQYTLLLLSNPPAYTQLNIKLDSIVCLDPALC